MIMIKMHCQWSATPWWISTIEMFAEFGGHAAIFADEAGFVLPNYVFIGYKL